MYKWTEFRLYAVVDIRENSVYIISTDIKFQKKKIKGLHDATVKPFFCYSLCEVIHILVVDNYYN